MYQSELIKESGLSPNTAVPLLNKLVGYGIVKENIVAGTKFYSVKDENPVIKQFKILANVSNLYDATRAFSDDTEIYLFGSAARGEDTENSDIDLLVIANEDKKSLSKLKEKIKDTLTEKLKREVNPVIFTPIEYASLYNKDKAFYDSIENDKIRVL
jgi:predicted nucleotidyltransferase